MRIPAIDSLPEAANGAQWARELDCNTSTIYRADVVLGKLKRSNPGGTQAIYTRRAVLEWLGLSNEVVPERPTLKAPKSLRRASKAYGRGSKSGTVLNK
jgi:hypothetical protein